MSIEKDIEEALMRHADDVKASPGAWNGIESRLRRSYRIRTAVISAAAAAAAVAAVVFVPKIVGSDRPGRVDLTTQPPSPTATEAGSGIIPQGWSGALNIAHGYWLVLPDDWRSGVFEGHYEYRPPGLPGLAVGEDTFAFETYMLAPDDPAPAEGSYTATEVGGRQAKRWERTESGGAHSVTYDVAWDCWAGPGVDVDCASPRLIVRLYASTSDLWAQFGASGERMVTFISHASGPAPTGNFRTTHGIVTENVDTLDEKTWALIRLLEAIVFADTDTVDSILSAEAKRQWRREEGDVEFYEPGGNEVLLRYEIASREDADANSSNFRISFTHGTAPDGPEKTWSAEFGVGPGKDVRGRQQRAVVRFVQA